MKHGRSIKVCNVSDRPETAHPTPGIPWIQSRVQHHHLVTHTSAKHLPQPKYQQQQQRRRVEADRERKGAVESANAVVAAARNDTSFQVGGGNRRTLDALWRRSRLKVQTRRRVFFLTWRKKAVNFFFLGDYSPPPSLRCALAQGANWACPVFPNGKNFI